MVILDSISLSLNGCNATKIRAQAFCIDDSAAVWVLKDVVTKAHVLHEPLNRCPEFARAQSVVTYRASAYVIGFLVMVKEGEKQQMTFRWNSIESIHITSVESREWIDLHRCTQCTVATVHELWIKQLSSGMLGQASVPPDHVTMSLFFISFRLLQFPGSMLLRIKM